MADRCIRRHVDKQDGQVVIRRVAAVPVMSAPAGRPAHESAPQPESGRTERSLRRKLRQAVSRS